MTDRPLRIAMFSDSALPILNGVSVSIDSLVQELRERGHSVCVFTAAYFLHRDSDPNTYRFPAAQTPWTKGYPLAFPPFYPMLYRFRRHRFDVIHTHTPWTIGFVGLRWGESHSIPVVGTYHTLYHKYAHYVPFLPKRYVRYKIAKHTNFYYNAVDRVITPTDASRKMLLRHSVKRPIEVIPTAQLPAQKHDRVSARQSLGVGPDHRVLLYVGRIAREKNMLTLMRSVATVMRTDPKTRFWLVGDGPSRAECEEEARRLGIGDRVRFAGFVPRDQVDRYYAASDLFVFASTTETQGLVVCEAMSHGLPAIVAQGGGAGASVIDGTNGFIVEPEEEALSAAMTRVMEDPALYVRLAEGARRSVGGYTIREMTDRVLEVYYAALRENAERQENELVRI